VDVRDGFIVGIYNYCDAWCETCAFTSHCRLFADMAETEAALDPHLQALANAPPLPQDVPPPPPHWMRELIDGMNDDASALLDSKKPAAERQMLPAHDALCTRAAAYCERVHEWLRARGWYAAADPRDPCAVVGWFHTLIPAKIDRAAAGFAEDDPAERDWPPDYDGSAKVALLGIERSHVAWLQIGERGLASGADVHAFVADLVWLGEEIERQFPNARAFVRPGFDEPEAVARMLPPDAAG
jgi:hypothetical protein